VKCLERASCRLRGQSGKIRRANRVAIECHMRGQDAKWLRKCLLMHGTPRMFASPTMDYWSARGLFFFFSLLGSCSRRAGTCKNTCVLCMHACAMRVGAQ